MHRLACDPVESGVGFSEQLHLFQPSKRSPLFILSEPIPCGSFSAVDELLHRVNHLHDW
jgi:hypothetical protein